MKKKKSSPADRKKELPVDEPKSFLEHLDELRSTIVWSVITLSIGVVVAIPFVPAVISLLKGPMLSMEGLAAEKGLISYEVAGPFMIAMKVAIWTGVLVSAPIVLFIIGNFVFPGLTLKERKVVKIAIGVSGILFCVGVWMCYVWTLPIALKAMVWFYDVLGLQFEGWFLGDYSVFVLRLLVAFGLAFELPVVVYLLGSFGIINSDQMRFYRRHVIVGLLVLAMFMTPADPWTMLLMACPLIVLYEITIWLVKLRETGSDDDDDDEDDDLDTEYDGLEESAETETEQV